MNKCIHCGYVFSDDDRQIETETHGLDAGPYESYSVCPMCKHDYEPAAQCDLCGEFFLDEKMHNGVCDKCIIESMTYENMANYLDDTEGELETFVFTQIFNIDPPDDTSIELRAVLKEQVRARIDIDKDLNTDDMLVKMQHFILDDSQSLELFAEYLKEVRANEKTV